MELFKQRENRVIYLIMINFVLGIFISSFLLAACWSDPVTKNNNDTSAVLKGDEHNTDRLADTIDCTVYDSAVQVDTNDCESFSKGRGLVAVLSAKRVVIETNSVDLYLRTDRLRMWTCNLPESIKETNIGDTIVVSASVYEVFGDERTWGKPTILYKINMKSGNNAK